MSVAEWYSGTTELDIGLSVDKDIIKITTTQTCITVGNVGIGTTSPDVRFVVQGNNADTSATHGTFYTLFTPSNNSGQLYLVSSWIPASDSPSNYHLVDIVTIANGIMRIINLQTTAYMSSQASSLNYQVKQVSGSTQTIRWTAIALK